MPTPRGIPTEPIENDPIEAYRGREVREIRQLLDEALKGLPLGAYDSRIIEWLKNGDQPTIVTLASLFVRARSIDGMTGTSNRPSMPTAWTVGQLRDALTGLPEGSKAHRSHYPATYI